MRHVLSRPTLDEVHAYRAHVDEAMARLLGRELPAAVMDLVTLGLNHEQQHQELIVTDVKYGLAANPLRPAYREANPVRAESLAHSSRRCDGRRFLRACYPVGFGGEGFAFDNEGPRHNVYLTPFRLASRLVTNGEYMEFIAIKATALPRCGCRMAGIACARTSGALHCIGKCVMASGGITRWMGCGPWRRRSRCAT